jgi:release factor glutamine methyltransferase
MTYGGVGGRLPTWSAGGPDGRLLLDRFLEGLAGHLAPSGSAVITHNAFVGLERSARLLQRYGLRLSVVSTTLVHIPREKLECMTRAVLDAEDGRSIHRYGPYVFADMHVVEIGNAEVAS